MIAIHVAYDRVAHYADAAPRVGCLTAGRYNGQLVVSQPARTQSHHCWGTRRPLLPAGLALLDGRGLTETRGRHTLCRGWP
jgi:hypothetical protein